MKPNVEIKAKVQAFIHKYLDVDPEQESLIANYALSTWMPLPETVKYLQFIGDYVSGKTRAGAVMAAICCKPFVADGFGSAMSVLMAMDELMPTTLIIDESGFGFAPEDNFIFSAMLRVGADISTPLHLSVTTVENEDVLVNFAVFGHKVLLCRTDFVDHAIQALCTTVKLIPTTRKDIPPALADDFERDKKSIWRVLQKFYSEALREFYLKTPVKENVYSPIAKYIESCFADGAKEVQLTDVRDFIQRSWAKRVTTHILARRVRELGYEMRRRGPDQRYYIQPKGGK